MRNIIIFSLAMVIGAGVGDAQEGPVAIILQPLPDTYTACEPDSIIMFIDDVDGVAPNTVIFIVENDTFTIDSDELSIICDTLHYHPSPPFAHGDTIDCSLIAAEDILGNPLQCIVVWSFMIDLEPPIAFNISPYAGETVSDTAPIISAKFYDDMSGVDVSSIVLIVYPDTFYWDDPGITILEGDTVELFFNPSVIGLSWTHGDLVNICFKVSDCPDYCSPNVLDTCQTFHIDTTDNISEKQIMPRTLSLAAFPNPFNSSVAITAPENAEVEIYDLRGKRIDDFRLTIDDSQHPAPITDDRLPITEFIWRPDQSIASGIYLVKARTADGRTAEKKVVLVR